MENVQKFGRYTIVRKLGEGAMGKVFLAHDPSLERNVALKVISIDAMVDKATRDDYLRRFSFEAKASARLSHPSIVAVYDAGEENGVPWIAFEYVQGETLEDLITRHGRLPVGRALTFAHDIAAALQHAHGWSIIHRDIKPANILIEASTGIAKLADFGIVKAPWAVISHDENTLGSPGYMSPEQIDGVDLDERADLFCLGVVIYQMIAGSHPFLRDTMAATIFATCNNDFTPLRDIVEAVPPALDWAVRRCIASDRDKRIRSADELVEMLNKAGDPRPQDHRVPSLSGAKAVPSALAPAPDREQPGTKQAASGPVALPAIIGRVIDNARTLGSRLVSGKGPEVLTAMSRFLRAVPTRVAAFAHRNLRSKYIRSLAIAAAAIVIAALTIALLSGGTPPLPPADSLEAKLIHECGIALRENNRALAMNTVDGLSSINSRHPLADVLIARVNIRNGRYEEAKSGLLKVESERGGTGVIKKQLPLILDDVSRSFKTGPADPELVNLVRFVLLAGRHPIVRSWVKNPSYWLRWNVVNILQASNVDVDMTAVYIQDLSCRDLLQIRLQAVARLSTSGDRRALDALREAAQHQRTDPLVAQSARKVLDEKTR
jgi:serine/threonine protein kinase